MAVLLIMSSCSRIPDERTEIDLSGNWQFKLDTANVGERQKWFLNTFNDTISLPGSMDENHKGFVNKDTTTMHLNRLYKYEGAAWYKKVVNIPVSFRDKHLELSIERTKPTKLWVDSIYIGDSYLLQSPQKYDLTHVLQPGKHEITVMVNNDLKLTPYGNVHIYSDDTQTNWNGMLGEIKIQAIPKTYISEVKIYPDVKGKSFDVKIKLDNGLNWENANVELLLERLSDGGVKDLKTTRHTISCDSIIYLNYEFNENECLLWDEYEQPLYTLKVLLSKGNFSDVKTITFGMRNFAVDGTQFSINGRKTFLRGKHEAAVFPLTGYPPMKKEEWVRVYEIAKSYGINHYRFHSYCPPEAAFEAADEVGMYLQVEVPFWGGLTDTVMTAMRKEGMAMLDAYANHPSFVMFSQGNELWSGIEYAEENVKAFQKYDHRPLYTMGSNNGIGYIEPFKESEYFVGARIPEMGGTTTGHTRLIHAFADAESGGILNTTKPNTEINYSFAVEHMDIPIVSHEIGQYQIYPDYKEINKYTGVLRAWNLEVFKKRLENAGMGDMDVVFQKASGAWSALCYKAEMEAAIRTPGFAGFQLLDLQDFPGQGTALVGILDAFMDSKGVVSSEVWKESCNDVVILAEFPKFCWSTEESFSAKITVANYSNINLSGPVNWSLGKKDGTLSKKGVFSLSEILNGGIVNVGNIFVDLEGVEKPTELILSLELEDGKYTNHYPVWVYPSKNKRDNNGEIVETDQLDGSVISRLIQGEKVLYFPKEEDIKDNSVAGFFPPEFWNYGMFKGISEWAKKPVSPGTLGLFMDPKHPLFDLFPTDFHTNWQWFNIVKNSRSLILDKLPKNYRPIVQVIDNLERDHKMGMIFEFKIGEGKLLVCTSRLKENLNYPEVNSFYNSIINYMNSDFFKPTFDVKIQQVKELF